VVINNVTSHLINKRIKRNITHK